MNQAGQAFTFIVGWLVIIFMLIVLTKTEIGHRIVYYMLWLGILFLFVTQYKFFTNILGTAGTTGSGGTLQQRGG